MTTDRDGAIALILAVMGGLVRWVTQGAELQAREILGSDFQWISRENDVLIRTYSPQDKREFLVLNELQLR